jgi:nucleoside phosphorylase
MSSPKRRLSPHDYTVGWISALPLELAAAQTMLDEEHLPLYRSSIRETDQNTYHLGEIGGHNVVMACLPSGVYGHTSAAVVAQQMLSTFPSIRLGFGLMVGIGGGSPTAGVDIRLGDIVVSKPTGRFPGMSTLT